MKKNQKSTKEEMYPIIDQWKESGLNQSQYCKQEKISYYVFKYWLQKYRKENIGVKQNLLNPFLPVQIPSTEELSKEPISKKDIIINYPNGIEVSCPVNIDIVQLRALVNI